MELIDLQSATFIGLITLGVVNVVLMFKADLDSRLKFLIAAIVAFGLTFVPTEFSNIILEKIKIALEVAFASSGAYKLAQKVGGE